MKTAICKLASASPYSQSKFINTPRLPKESHPDYETRTWRERLHYDGDGQVFIPPMQFTNCIKEAAKFLSISIPGEGKAKYTKHFEAGVMVAERMYIGIHKDKVLEESLLVPSDGKRGGGKRVIKTFPLITEWIGEVVYHVIDDKITEEIFTKVLTEAGLLIGIGRFRPKNWGYYGRFNVMSIAWSDRV